MKRYVYRERDYAFGQLILALRTTIGLSQAGLGERLRISRRAVAEWEGGLSYPKAERLQQLIALGMQQQAFPAGREEQEIRALWKAAHQKVLLDEAWLADLLAPPASVQPSPRAGMPAALAFAEPAALPRVDWVEALDVSHFAGREVEVAELSQWIVQERCRLVALLGMGGIGKSMLASYLGSRLVPHFEAVLWRSVRDAPPCEELVADCLTFFSETPPAEFPASLEQRITQLLSRLQARRCLLVLDNLETLLESGDRAGNYLPGYEGYGRLIQRLAESAHQSCVLLTSREKPKEIEPLEGMRSPVRTLRLGGVDEQAARVLLSDKGLSGTSLAWQGLVASYAGNPLALKIVAQAISDLFGGDLDRFLQEGELIFNGVRPVLHQQVGRLTPLEHLLLTWLAVLSEWTTLDTLSQVLHPRVLRSKLLEALEALSRRSLLEWGQQASFGLQSVVMEYLTDELGERLSEEIVRGSPKLLRQVALAQAQAKDYVRKSQVRLLVYPLLEQLRAELGANAQVEAHLLGLLALFRTEDAATEGYGPANVITLLTALQGHLRGLDLSRLSIRGASLQGVEMQDTSLAGATLRDITFTEAFDDTWSLAISRDGHYWAVSGKRGAVRVWQAGRLHLIWQAHTRTIMALAFRPDGRTLATGSTDGSLKLWDLEHGDLLWTAWLPESVNYIAFAPDGGVVASCGNDAVIRLWDVPSGTPLQTLIGHTGPLFALAWNPDGRLLASGGVDGVIRLWDLSTERSEPSVRVLSGHTNWVSGLAFSPDGHDAQTLASASWDRTVKLWDVGEEGSVGVRQTLTGHTDYVFRLAWSPDGHLLASCGRERAIWLWDVEQSSYRMALHGHSAAVHDVAFTPESRYLLSGSEDGTVRTWDVESGQCVHIMQGYAITLYDLDWNPDSTRLASVGSDNLVTIWDGAGKKRPMLLAGHRVIPYGVAWSPDGRLLASAGEDNAVRVWDASTGTTVQVLRDFDHADALFHSVAWSPDGTFLAAGSALQGVQVWEVATGEYRWVGRTDASARLRRIAWSPDGTLLAGCGEKGSVLLWKASDGTLVRRLQGHRSVVECVVWSLDGERLAGGSGYRGSGEIFIWNAHSGERLYSLKEPGEVVQALAWSSTGEVLVSGGSDGMLRWWDLRRGECVQVRKAHQGAVQSLKRSPDGQWLASCGDDGAIHLWDGGRGEHLRTLCRDRPYERLTITGIRGLTQAEIATLRALGAVEDVTDEQSPSPGQAAQF